MNDSNKWVKLHSQMLNWEWYKNQNTKALFIHLLLKANWKDGKFQGYEVPRGSLVTGRKQLASELGISEQSIRTSLNNLKSTNEITITTTKKFSIITVVNYDKYQMTNQVANQQLTNNQPTTNQQLTTIEEYKNNRLYSTTNNIYGRGMDIFSYIENSFGRTLSPSEYEIINTWEDNELTRYAIKQAELNRAFNIKYVETILESYKNDGVKTITEAEERDKRHKQKKYKKTNEPIWFNQEIKNDDEWEISDEDKKRFGIT